MKRIRSESATSADSAFVPYEIWYPRPSWTQVSNLRPLPRDGDLLQRDIGVADDCVRMDIGHDPGPVGAVLAKDHGDRAGQALVALIGRLGLEAGHLGVAHRALGAVDQPHGPRLVGQGRRLGAAKIELVELFAVEESVRPSADRLRPG